MATKKKCHKSYANQVSRAWLHRELYRAYLAARKHKRHTKDVYLFEMNLTENLTQLCEDIIRQRYQPSRSIAFIVRFPVIREIFAAPFRDRIVHHFLYNMSYDWWDRRLIYDSYSCRIGKGALLGILRLQHFIRSASEDYTKEAYVLKLDIQGYFMSLSRQKLFDRICWGIERQFAGNRNTGNLMKYLWKQIIFDDPCKGVRIRGYWSNWSCLPKTKSLFYQKAGYGIVIGNLSSQLLSNIMLDQLDRYIYYELGYKRYGRYVDDFYIVVTAEELAQLKKDISKIDMFLKEELELTLHPRKRYLQEVHKGVEFLGAVVYPNHLAPSKRFKNNFYKAAAEVGMGYRDANSIISYLGLSKHYDSKKFSKRVFDYYGWDYSF